MRLHCNMTSKGRDLYRTFKRSISSSVNEVWILFLYFSIASTVHSYLDVLLNGRVEYSVKFLGSQEVKEAKGTDTIRDAIHAIRFQLQKVDIQINVEGVIVVDSKTKMVLHRYPLQKISFCADDKQQITLTVGEAFDLAYKRYMDKNKTSLENQKQVFVLRKRIAELESENQVLSERLAEAISSNKATQMVSASESRISLLDAPALPLTPVPSGPPPGVTAKISDVNQFLGIT
uniref:PID domain-containing protein n=1 Tax=Heterorhabditis bacteriophora TaxID=37862 RepID=A0A1I7WYY7_HETBA